MKLLQRSFQKLSKFGELANHDFCPWANHYVYWLKEPVGWFVIALAASLLVGAFLSPIGWAMATGLTAILLLGLGFPWIATRSVRCRLKPVCDQLHERDAAQLELTIRNFLPIPLMGLTIEGYLSQPEPLNASGDVAEQAAIGLGRIPAFCTATFRIPISPEYRGRYPVQTPQLTCSFPFGIWTAKKPLQHVEPVVVLPLIIPCHEEVELSGKQIAETGCGHRASTHGDFLGVREFRRGDSLRSIHWVQSARLDSLIVCERGGPQHQAVEIHLETSRSLGSAAEARENLAWRIRIAASIIAMLSARHLPFRLLVDGCDCKLSEGAGAKVDAWKLLSEVPIDGPIDAPTSIAQARKPSTVTWFSISACDEHHSSLDSRWIRLEAGTPKASRSSRDAVNRLIDLDDDISSQLDHCIMEAGRVQLVA